MEKATPRLTTMLINAAAFVIIVAGLKAAAPIIVQLLLAIFIAVITTPLFIGMQRKGVPPWIALLVLILGLVLISFFGVGIVGHSLNDFTKNMPGYQDRLQGQVTALVGWLASHRVNVPKNVVAEVLDMKNLMSVAGNTVSAFTGLLGKVFVILLITIFILFEAAILPRKLRAMPGLSDENWARMQQVVETFRRYMGMKTLLSLVTGVLLWFLLTVLGVSFAVLLGVLAFILNFVPNIGSILAAVPAVLLALIEFGGGRAIGVGMGYLVINVLIGNIIEPRVMGRGLGVSPMIIVISLIFWGWVLGPIGMLLSVPLTMTIKIAMESIEETRGMAILIGSAVPEARGTPPDKPATETPVQPDGFSEV